MTNLNTSIWEKIPDWFAIAVLFFIIPALLSLVIPISIIQAVVAGSIATIGLVSYRYAVKSNIRSAVNELEPLVVGHYRIVPTIRDVKWRPQVARYSWIPFSPATTILFNLYKEEEKQGVVRPADMEELLINWDIDCDYLNISDT